MPAQPIKRPMKILFLQPPARTRQHESILVPPLGLLSVATVLKRAGYDISIRDTFAEGMDWEEFEAFIRSESPDVLGIGGMTPVVDTTFRAIRIARPYCRTIIMGGPHVSLFGQKVFEQCAELDYGICGEGEYATLALLEALAADRPTEHLPGIVHRTFHNPPGPAMIDMNSMPYPDRSMLNNALYRYPLARYRPVTTMFTSRGCPYQCVFCDKSIFGSTWRSRDAEHVLSEIDEIINVHGIRSIIFYDDLFTVDKNRVAAICEGILARGRRIDWKCEGRVNLVDPDLLRLMKRAGCSMIAYGAESGNQSGLDYLNKKTTPEQIVTAFEKTRQARIPTMAYFLLGIPVETYEDEIRTIEFAKKIKPTYAQFSILSPFYGTALYNDAVSRGWYREIDAQNPLDKDLKRPVIISKNWDEEKLRLIVREAYRRFYFRPAYMARYLLSLRSLAQLSDSLKTVTRLFRWFSR